MGRWSSRCKRWQRTRSIMDAARETSPTSSWQELDGAAKKRNIGWKVCAERGWKVNPLSERGPSKDRPGMLGRRKFTEWFKRANSGIVKFRGPRRTIDPVLIVSLEGSSEPSRQVIKSNGSCSRCSSRCKKIVSWPRAISGKGRRVWQMEIKV